MTVTVVSKNGTRHIHTLVRSFQTYDYYSFSDGDHKEFQLYGYNLYKSYPIKEIANILFDFDAN